MTVPLQNNTFNANLSMMHLRSLCIHFFVIFMAACNKDNPPTTINGVVTDFKTGLPIKSASINYGTFPESNSQNIHTGAAKSNEEGAFFISMDYDDVIFIFEVNKINYLTDLNFGGEPVSFEKGESNDLEVKLHPLDAVIRVICNNTLPLHDSLYIQIQSKTLLKVQGLAGSAASIKPGNYPIVTPFSGQKISDIRFLSGEMAYLYWSFSQFGKTDQAAFRDSVFLATGDTAVYNINY